MSLKVHISQQVNTVLDPKNYDKLLEMIFKNNFQFLDCIADVPYSSKDRAEIAEMICTISECFGNSSQGKTFQMK